MKRDTRAAFGKDAAEEFKFKISYWNRLTGSSAGHILRGVLFPARDLPVPAVAEVTGRFSVIPFEFRGKGQRIVVSDLCGDLLDREIRIVQQQIRRETHPQIPAHPMRRLPEIVPEGADQMNRGASDLVREKFQGNRTIQILTELLQHLLKGFRDLPDRTGLRRN